MFNLLRASFKVWVELRTVNKELFYKENDKDFWFYSVFFWVMVFVEMVGSLSYPVNFAIRVPMSFAQIQLSRMLLLKFWFQRDNSSIRKNIPLFIMILFPYFALCANIIVGFTYITDFAFGTEFYKYGLFSSAAFRAIYFWSGALLDLLYGVILWWRNAAAIDHFSRLYAFFMYCVYLFPLIFSDETFIVYVGFYLFFILWIMQLIFLIVIAWKYIRFKEEMWGLEFWFVSPDYKVVMTENLDLFLRWFCNWIYIFTPVFVYVCTYI